MFAIVEAAGWPIWFLILASVIAVGLAVSAVSGLEQINSTSSEGNSNIQLNFTWGHDLNEAMDDIRTRIDRVKARLPEDADPPIIQKFDSNAMPY